MPEVNIPPCRTHGSLTRALHEPNFGGIVTVISEIIDTVSGVGTVSYSRCPYGYDANFDGIVRALEDLNTSISGIQGGGGGPEGILPGSGIYVQPVASGEVEIGINIIGEGGIDVIYSGEFVIISGQSDSAISVISGIAAGPGIDVFASGAFTVIQTDLIGEGTVDFSYRNETGVISGAANTDIIITSGGANTTVSGNPGTNYRNGSLWFDTNQGRLFVYASGEGIEYPDWYQTNAEAIALKGDTPPSGTGNEAPPRDGSLWFNSLMGGLFVYDTTTSGWYETAPTRQTAFSSSAPTPKVPGETWYSSTDSQLKVWNGTDWVDANT